MVSVAVEFGAAGGSTWTPLTCDVFGLGWSRGASEDRGVISVPEAGELVAYLVDQNRDLDPDNGAGAFAGAIDIGARFRVTLAGVIAFAGRIDQIAHDLDPPQVVDGSIVPLARIAVVDAIAAAAAVDTIANPTFPQESTSARIARLLDGAGVATGVGQRDLEAGGELLQAGALLNDVWSDLLAVVQNELGSIDFRPDGKVVSRLRATAWTPSAAVLHLGCDTGGIPLDSLRLMSERSTIRNRISAARAGGTAIVEERASSITKYGLRATQRHDLILLDDAAVDAWALFSLNRSSTPSRGFENASVTADAAAVAAIEAVPLFTGRVHLYQEGAGATIDRTLRLLGVAWDIDERANATATLTLGTDTALLPTSRSITIDTDAGWIARLGGVSSGPVGWIVDGGRLRAKIAGEPFDSAGGVDSLVIAWSSSL